MPGRLRLASNFAFLRSVQPTMWARCKYSCLGVEGASVKEGLLHPREGSCRIALQWGLCSGFFFYMFSMQLCMDVAWVASCNPLCVACSLGAAGSRFCACLIV